MDLHPGSIALSGLVPWLTRISLRRPCRRLIGCGPLRRYRPRRNTAKTQFTNLQKSEKEALALLIKTFTSYNVLRR